VITDDAIVDDATMDDATMDDATMDDATKTVSGGTSTKRKVGSNPIQESTSSSDEPNSPTTPTDNKPGLSNVAGASKLES